MSFRAACVPIVMGALAVGCGQAEEASSDREGDGGPPAAPIVGPTIPLGDGESGVAGVAVGEGGVWAGRATGSCSGSVSRIDPRTDAVVATISTGWITDVAVGSGAVWALGGVCVQRKPRFVTEAVLFRIDPRRGELLATVALPRGGDARVTGVAAGEGGVWVAQSYDPTRGEIVRIDPATNDVVARIPLESHPGDLAVGAGAVWVLSDPAYTDESMGGASLLRIDPTSDEVAATYARGELEWIGADLLPPMLAVGEDAVWVGSWVERPTAPTVPDPLAIRIDPATGETARERVPIERFRPYPFAVAEDGVWFVGPRSTISRLDPETLAVEQSSEPLNANVGDAAYDPATRTAWIIADAVRPAVIRVDLP